MKALRKNLNRIVSMVCILSMLFGVLMPLTNRGVVAEEIEYAHTLNIFGINLKSGADYYYEYELPDPDPTADPTLTSEQGVYVWTADKSNEGHKFVFNIKMSISGEGTSEDEDDPTASAAAQSAISEGFIRISIPAHILKYKGSQAGVPSSDGVYPDELELPVPEVSTVPFKVQKVVDPVTSQEYEQKIYSGNHDFVYEYNPTNDTYEIFNIQPVSAGVVYEFPVAYMMNKPTWEYEELEASAPCQATISINTWKKGDNPSNENLERIEVTAQSNKIPVYIDTNAKIKSVSKSTDSAFYSADSLKSKLDITENLSDDYRYVLWSVTSDITSVTQKYDLIFDDDLHNLTGTDGEDNLYDIAGEVYAIKYSKGPLKIKGTADYNKITNLSAEGKRTDYIIVRYPYDLPDTNEDIKGIQEAALDKRFEAVNDVTVTLDPADEKDAVSTAADDGAFVWEMKLPKWEPVETVYKPEKYGIYNNNKHVSNVNNISNYQLANLSDYDGTDTAVIKGLRYETKTDSYAYGKTIEDLNKAISSLELEQDGTATVIKAVSEDAGTDEWSRKYTFYENNTQTFTYNDGTSDTVINIADLGFDFSDSTTLAPIDMQRIAAKHIDVDYYGKYNLKYVFKDDSLTLISDVKKSNDENYLLQLDTDDYKMDSVEFEMSVKSYNYDAYEMKYTETKLNESYSTVDADNTLYFYVYNEGTEVVDQVASYNFATNTGTVLDSEYVDRINDGVIVFKSDKNITGYRIETENKYFYANLVTHPSVTIKPSSEIVERVNPLFTTDDADRKIGIKNTAEYSIIHTKDDVELYKKNISGTDYIADIVRSSSIRKKALGEKTSYVGKDGKTYKSENDTLLNQYRLAWQTNIAETAQGIYVDGVLVENAPVRQESGIFYDLLPSHCDIIEGSVNVYADCSGDVKTSWTPLSPSEFEVLDRIDNYNGSGKKLLIIKIKAPCKASYTVTYVTVHAHEDIQDFGSYVVNTVAYQTGNTDIAGGYPDDGGNHAVSMSDYMKNLDPDNGKARRFIYAESTEDILALFPTSSGIYKKVSTESNPTYSRSGVVYTDETYTYNFRMKNDSSTTARDIAILDSIENYRTITDEYGNTYKINSGVSKDRDWHGTIESFDLSSVEDKMGDYKNDLKLIFYISDDVDTDAVNLEDYNYSDKYARRYLLRTILGDEMTEEEKVTAIKSVLIDEAEKKGILDPDAQELYATTNLTTRREEMDAIAQKWVVVENWNDLSTTAAGQPIDISKVGAFIVYTGKNFVLGKGESLSFNMKMKTPESHVTHQGEDTLDVANGIYLTRPRTYNNVYRSFTTYPESASGTVLQEYFYTHYDHTQLEYCTVGDVKFYKIDNKTGEGLAGISFNLSGVSDYGTAYNETLISDSSGYVLFENLERGTYQLIESSTDDDHLIDTTPREVKITIDGKFIFVSVDGEEVQGDEVNGYMLTNKPRYHGEFFFDKLDILDTDKGVAGAKFVLYGTSDHGTIYKYDSANPDNSDLVAVSDENGRVSFGDIERGTYTLIEIETPDGYEPPSNNVFNVTSKGEESVVFTISGENAGKNTAGINYIYNTPLAEMNIIKADEITKKSLADASFKLIAADAATQAKLDELDFKIDGITDGKMGDEFGWTKLSGEWTQEIIHANLAGGEYGFKCLPAGTYTLTETIVPEGYGKILENSYTVTITADTVAKKNVIEFGDTTGMQYVRLDLQKGDYVPTTKEKAQYYRIFNTQKYEEGKKVFKSWVGSTLPGEYQFPIFHLSSEQPEEKAKSATLDTNALITQIADRGVNNVRIVNSTDQNKAEGAFKLSLDNTEEGKIWAWWDGSDLKLWFGETQIAYLPEDCSNLFKNVETQIKSVDFSKFYVDKVTTFKEAFKGCTNLETITFNNSSLNNVNFANGSSITSMKSMFEDCGKLTAVDLNYLTNTYDLTDTSSMFKNCTSISSIKLGSLETSGVTDMSYMFGMSDETQNLNNVENNNNPLVSAIKNNALTSLDISSFNTENCRTFKAMFQGMAALTSINLDYTKFTAGSNLETVERMFCTCVALKGIDLRGFGNCNNLQSIARWFQNCQNIEYIDLSNFETSNTLSDILGVFYHTSQNTGSDPGTNTGCRIFAKCKWENSYTANNEFNFDYFRINMYGKMYKNSNDVTVGTVQYKKGGSAHLDIQYQESLITNDSNKRLSTGYFMSAYTDSTCTEYNNFYTTYVATKYTSSTPDPGSDPGTTPDPGEDPEDPAEDSYANFEKDGDPELKEVTGRTDVGSKTFTFEYETTSGYANCEKIDDNTYKVKENIYLIVKTLVQDGNKYYISSQKYKYTLPAEAVWKYVVRTDSGNAQWECELQVQNADDEFFAWENNIANYVSTADQDNPIVTQGEDDEAVITNSASTIEVGSLKLQKILTGETDEKFSEDEFWFKVTMKEADGTTPYTMKPFDSSGVAYFKVRAASAEESNSVLIKGIPANCKYTVEEVTDPTDTDHLMPDGYEFHNIESDRAGDTVENGVVSGSIVVNKTNIVTAENTVKTTELSVQKNAEIFRKNEATGLYVQLTEQNADDLDYQAWMNRSFKYTFIFENLVKNKEYYYTIYDITGATPVSVKNGTFIAINSPLVMADISLKPGQKAVITGLPTGTKYTVLENNSDLVDTDTESYNVKYVVNGGSTGSVDFEVSGAYKVNQRELADDEDQITYTNSLYIDKPETVSVTVSKKWYEYGSDPSDESTNPVEFCLDPSGKNLITNSEAAYPSFVRVIIGRALKYTYQQYVDEQHYVDKELLMEAETAYESYSINIKDILKAQTDYTVPINHWDYEFTNLPKYGHANINNQDVVCEYVYFVSEVMPLGFEDANTSDDMIEISGTSFHKTSKTAEDNKYICTLKNREVLTQSLTVTKYVSGNMSDISKEYSFEVELKDETGSPLTGTGFVVEFTDAEGNMVRSRTYTSENGKMTIGISHCHSFTISNLPKNTIYKITEKNSSLGGSIVYSGVVDTGNADQFISPTETDKQGKPNYKNMIELFKSNVDYSTNVQSGRLTDDVSYLYWNNCDVGIITGIDMSFRVPLLFASALAAMIAFILFKRRRDKE